MNKQVSHQYVHQGARKEKATLFSTTASSAEYIINKKNKNINKYLTLPELVSEPFGLQENKTSSE